MQVIKNRTSKDVRPFLSFFFFFCSSNQCGPRLKSFSNVVLRVKSLRTPALDNDAEKKTTL